jgi:chitinase
MNRRLSGIALAVALVCALVAFLPDVSAAAACATAWAANTAYATGVAVSYSGHNYTCIQAHTSLVGWEPPNVPALWGDQGVCTGSATATATTAPRATATATTAPRATPTATTVRATATATARTGATATSTTRPTATSTARPTATSTTRPTATSTTPPTATPTSGGALPAKVITGYWQNFNNGAQVLKLIDVPSKYNLIAVAFADTSTPAGAVTFNLDLAGTGYPDVATFKADVNTLHGQGRKVVISVGGQNGTITVADSGAATNFANSVVSLMNTYGFDGVDIDLENGINATYMTQALKSVRTQKPGAILTMAPQTIDMTANTNGYFRVAIDANVDIVNTQFYNSGCMLGCDGQCYSQATENFLTGLTCVQIQGGLRGDQIGLGVPASTSAAGGGYVAPSVVNAALNCVKSGTNCGTFVPPANGRATLRGAMTWSINWDGTSAYAWVNGITVP